MKTTHEIALITYIEIPRRSNNPVKIDAILEARMRVFLRAKRIKRWMASK